MHSDCWYFLLKCVWSYPGSIENFTVSLLHSGHCVLQCVYLYDLEQVLVSWSYWWAKFNVLNINGQNSFSSLSCLCLLCKYFPHKYCLVKTVWSKQGISMKVHTQRIPTDVLMLLRLKISIFCLYVYMCILWVNYNENNGIIEIGISSTVVTHHSHLLLPSKGRSLKVHPFSRLVPCPQLS